MDFNPAYIVFRPHTYQGGAPIHSYCEQNYKPNVEI